MRIVFGNFAIPQAHSPITPNKRFIARPQVLRHQGLSWFVSHLTESKRDMAREAP